jgi:hypothetical protein
MKRHHFALALALVLLFAASTRAQSLGTFRWQLKPFGSVLVLNVTQQGSIYVLNGFEQQCFNPSLPAWGVAVPQANGSILFGITTITDQGHGLHTRASISPSGLSGTWRDNGNSNGEFAFNPGNTCPGGPRVGPLVPDSNAPTGASDGLAALRQEIAALQKRLKNLESKNQ